MPARPWASGSEPGGRAGQEPDALGEVVDSVTYASTREGVSQNRAVDGDPESPLTHHDEVEGAAGGSSPGLRADGSAW